MSPARDDLPEFHCPNWPACGCPDGTVRTDCPGLGKRPARVVEFPGTHAAPKDWAEPYMGEPDGFTRRETAVMIALSLIGGILVGGGVVAYGCIGGWL